ncbi:MAG: hypothetical protein HY912_24220 [Desulfomonile tiedjei]|uniref:Uncharacterized protein n=1 Tax=Desulfomonile tiedjei TaxID=2358 RepID=A0A9D6Z5X8_9BACT|nr:hypothetical protein [Desulfomonile tiedjei]
MRAPYLNGHATTSVAIASPSIVEMVRCASHKKHRLAMIAGFVLGGWIPITTYSIIHWHVQSMPLLWLLVAGGLVYSALTVYQWAKLAFHQSLKAIGFVVLLEGAMTFVPDPWIGVPCLFLLVIINGLATGTTLALDHHQHRRELPHPHSRLRPQRDLVRG